MNSSGSGKEKVYDSIVWDGEPCFNHNWSLIYFASEHVEPFSPEYINIHRINSDGTRRVQLTSDANQKAPDVSPLKAVLLFTFQKSPEIMMSG